MKTRWILAALLMAGGTGVRAQSWVSQTLPASSTLRAIHFIDASKGWAAGYDGVIYHTTDGGTNWSQQSTGISTRFVALRFIDADYGWANTGLKVFRTENGGTTWNDMTGLDLNAAIFRNTIFPVSSTVAWSAVLCGSCNGGLGQRWFYRYTATSATTVTEQTFNLLGSSVQLLDMWFVDADNGWAVGSSGQIWMITSASGGSPVFTNQTNTGITSATLRGVCMVDVNNGWAVGDGGTIIKTTNGGTNWTKLTSGTSTALRDVYAVDMDHVIVVGDGGLIRSTTDGGANWTAQTSGVSTILWSVGYVGYALGYAAGGDPSTSGNGVALQTTSVLPAELVDFDALVVHSGVALTWSTISERDVAGFEVERLMCGTATWMRVGLVAGIGSSNSLRSYSFKDTDLHIGRYAYRLKQFDRSGAFTYSNTVEVEIGVPANTVLHVNYPNPFNPLTTISCELGAAGNARLAVYDLLGREVAVLVNGPMEAGIHTVTWDAGAIPSGIYFCRLNAGGELHTRKLMVAK